MFRKFLVLGPIARYAEDLHLAIKVMSADCGQNLRLDEPVDVSKLNVFYLEDAGYSFGIQPTGSDIRNCILRAVDHFRERGAKIHRVSLSLQIHFSISEIIECSLNFQPVIDEFTECCEICIARFFDMKDMPDLLVPPDGSEKSNVNASLEFLKAMVGLSPYTKSAIFVSLLKDLGGLILPSDVPKYLEKLQTLEEKIFVS